MTLAERLSAYDEKYWDFSEYRNDSPLVRYPAVMVAPMQACILKEIINADPATSIVLDPFCGSGTVLCEGQKLGLNVMGFDINPLAVLIAAVQLEGVPADCAVRSINAINTITFFKEHIQNNYVRYIKDNSGLICLKCGDSKELLGALDANSVDLICTSPPYGDNHTTVTYGQFSILPLLWIDKKDLHIWDETLLETFTAIDSASLGGRVKRKLAGEHSYDEFVGSISLEKQKKVIAFLEDYEAIFSLLARVLKPGKLLVLT